MGWKSILVSHSFVASRHWCLIVVVSLEWEKIYAFNYLYRYLPISIWCQDTIKSKRRSPVSWGFSLGFQKVHFSLNSCVRSLDIVMGSQYLMPPIQRARLCIPRLADWNLYLMSFNLKEPSRSWPASSFESAIFPNVAWTLWVSHIYPLKFKPTYIGCRLRVTEITPNGSSLCSVWQRNTFAQTPSPNTFCGLPNKPKL